MYADHHGLYTGLVSLCTTFFRGLGRGIDDISYDLSSLSGSQRGYQRTQAHYGKHVRRFAAQALTNRSYCIFPDPVAWMCNDRGISGLACNYELHQQRSSNSWRRAPILVCFDCYFFKYGSGNDSSCYSDSQYVTG